MTQGTGAATVDAVLAALVAEPDRALVALDYDGTLAPVVTRPEDAAPAPGAIEAVRRLAGCIGTVAIVTGRPVEQLLELSGLAAFSSLERLTICGHYGLERWDGTERRLVKPPRDPRVDEARELLSRLVALCPDGVRLEDKGHSVAVHTRESADPLAALAAVRPGVYELALETGLELVPGRLVLELRPAGTDKGRTLHQLVQERDPACVVFIGDDLGDGPAFDAVEELRLSGTVAAAVFSDSAEGSDALRDRADLVVPGPTGVVAFLDRLADGVRRAAR